VTEHDPLDAAGVEREDTPTPWASLAQQCRWLAEMADTLAAADPASLAPARPDDPDVDDEEPADRLAMLDECALAIRSVVAACRRATWQHLLDAGRSMTDIAEMWGITRQAVSQTLTSPGRPRGRKG